MLYVELEIEKALAEVRDAKEKQRKPQEPVKSPQETKGAGGGPSTDPRATADCQSLLMTDSEWLGLSTEEQLAWAKNTEDPRISVGSQSPLEKKIQRLGGTHSSRVRKLLAHKLQEEDETLQKLKALSYDFRIAQAEAYYYHRYQEIMMDEWKRSMLPQWETKTEGEKKLQRERTRGVKKWDFLVSKRELSQIQKHTYRAERARGLRDHNYHLLLKRSPIEVSPPKTSSPIEKLQKTPQTKSEKHKVAWVSKQMKGHRDRMIRGRELTEQRNNQKEAEKLCNQVPPCPKSPVKKGKAKEFEWVTAYPIVQPHRKALLEVTVLMEKSKKEDDTDIPPRREFLSMPLFLRSQLEKSKG